MNPYMSALKHNNKIGDDLDDGNDDHDGDRDKHIDDHDDDDVGRHNEHKEMTI